jgi:O-antigen/teichoic acid export membrane protein
VLGHSAVYLVVRICNGLLSLAAIALLTRLLDPSEYGAYVLGMAFVGVLTSVLFHWINASVARFYPASGPGADGVLTTAQGLFIRVAVGAAVIAAAGASFGGTPLFSIKLALIVVGTAISMGWHDLHLQIANARREPLTYGAITVTRATTGLGLAIGLVQLGLGASGALLAVGVGCVLAVTVFGARWSRPPTADNAPLRRELVHYGAPIALTSAMTMTFSLADRFIVGLWHGPEAVAGYGAAYDLVQQMVGALLSVFFLASYPLVAAAWETGGAAAARAACDPLARALLLVSPLAVAVLTGMAPEIARFMLGAGIRDDAIVVMPWIAVAICLSCFKAYYFDIALLLSMSTTLLLRITATMAALSLTLNLLLVPGMALQGAAIAAAASFGAGAALSWWYGRKRGVYPSLRREALKSLTALVATLVALRLAAGEMTGDLPNDLGVAFLQLAAGIAVFLACALLTNLSQLRSRAVLLWRASRSTVR